MAAGRDPMGSLKGGSCCGLPHSGHTWGALASAITTALVSTQRACACALVPISTHGGVCVTLPLPHIETSGLPITHTCPAFCQEAAVGDVRKQGPSLCKHKDGLCRYRAGHLSKTLLSLKTFSSPRKPVKYRRLSLLKCAV